MLPRQPLKDRTIELSICDVYSPKVWVTQIHFFPVESHANSFSLFKEGLSRTINDVPALIGTLGRTSDDPRDLVIKVQSDGGVEFGCEDLLTAKDVPSYSDLKADGFPINDLAEKLLPKVVLTPVSEGLPILAAKLNLLNGGLALSFGFNHLLCDASAIAEIERLWALHTSDACSGREWQSHRSATPDIAVRKWISTLANHSEDFEDDLWKVFPTHRSQLNLPREPVSVEAALTEIQEAKKARLEQLNGNVDETKWSIWYFSPESLVSLKKDASIDDGGQWVSTLDALMGLFWSRISVIKPSITKTEREGDQVSQAIFPLNLRQRVNPTVSAQFIGNLIDITSSDCRLDDLQDGVKGILNAARSIRKTIQSWSQSKWQAWIAKALILPYDEAICPNPLSLLEVDNVAFNDYSRSQCYASDWGEGLGRIDATRYPKPAASMAGCATAVVVHPRLADGGLEVAMTSNDDVRQAMERDEIFQRYAKLKCISF